MMVYDNDEIRQTLVEAKQMLASHREYWQRANYNKIKTSLKWGVFLIMA